MTRRSVKVVEVLRHRSCSMDTDRITAPHISENGASAEQSATYQRERS